MTKRPRPPVPPDVRSEIVEAKKGTLSEEQIHNLLATIETMLRSSSLTVTWARGIRRIDNWDTGQVELSPTEGQTLTLTVHGGARDIDGGVILGGQENPIAVPRRRGKKA